MPARPFHALLAAPAPGLLGFALGLYVGGVGGGLLVAGLAAIAAVVLASTSQDGTHATLRIAVFSAFLIAAHVAALYTFADAGHTPLLSTDAQLLLAVPAMALPALVWGRLRGRPMTRERIPDDDDATLELPVRSVESAATATTSLPTVVTPAAREAAAIPRWRTPLALGIVSTALFVVATMFWLSDDPPHASLGSAVAREMPATPSESPTPPAGETVVIAEPEATPAPAPPAPVPPSADNGIAPSAARRECMAQIESARLFLQLARQTSDRDGYARAIESQIDRMVKSRPVGPRTLSRIADRMWESRAAPEREPTWWSSQFRRCEEARTAGSWYVVRG